MHLLNILIALGEIHWIPNIFDQIFKEIGQWILNINVLYWLTFASYYVGNVLSILNL